MLNATMSRNLTPSDRAALEDRIPAMTDAEVTRAYKAAEVESEEADLLAGEMERRDLDD